MSKTRCISFTPWKPLTSPDNLNHKHDCQSWRHWKLNADDETGEVDKVQDLVDYNHLKTTSTLNHWRLRSCWTNKILLDHLSMLIVPNNFSKGYSEAFVGINHGCTSFFILGWRDHGIDDFDYLYGDRIFISIIGHCCKHVTIEKLQSTKYAIFHLGDEIVIPIIGNFPLLWSCDL